MSAKYCIITSLYHPARTDIPERWAQLESVDVMELLSKPDNERRSFIWNMCYRAYREAFDVMNARLFDRVVYAMITLKNMDTCAIIYDTMWYGDYGDGPMDEKTIDEVAGLDTIMQLVDDIQAL